VTAIGLWIAIVGYGLAYSGWVQLGGGKCSLVDGFRGQCSLARTTAAAGASTGTTLLGAHQASQQQQAGMIGTQPIPQVA
jgi:hypothetical protein